MTGSAILTILMQAAQAAVAGYLGKKAKSGVETILAWIDDRVAAQPSLKMSATGRKNIEKLLAENPTLFENSGECGPLKGSPGHNVSWPHSRGQNSSRRRTDPNSPSPRSAIHRGGHRHFLPF